MTTKKVRIALAIDKDGDWNASGWGRDGKITADADMMSSAVEMVADGENQFWIEAEVEIPEPKTLQGVVTKNE